MAKIIAVTGKGGTGKTTMAALITKILCEKKMGPVLAVDADPDANLGTILGVPVESTIGELREEVLEQMKDFPAGMSKQSFIEAGLHQIVEETPEFDLLTMGRSEGPGCYCYINNLLRKFADMLNRAYDWVVIDNEAGLEHISRRTASKVDYLFVIANENPLSLDSARRIAILIDELKNPVTKRYLLLNGVREDRVELLKERSAKLQFELVGAVPYDTELEWALFRGESVLNIGHSQAVDKLGEIMEKIGVC